MHACGTLRARAFGMSPTQTENQPLTTLEAFASATPVVTTPTEDDTGFSMNLGNPPSIAVRLLTTDGGRWRALSGAERRIYERSYRVKQWVEDVRIETGSARS